MSDPSSSGTEKTGSPKKQVSPARNAVGVVVLLVVIVIGVFQYSAVLGYNAAVKAIEVRAQDEEKGLLELGEAERLLRKAPDGPGTDIDDGSRVFTKTTYTWRGALKSYTLTAYYTKGLAPCLHHYEPDGTKYAPETVAKAPDDPEDMAPPPKKARAKKKAPGPANGSPKADATKGAVPTKANAPAPAPEPSKPAAKTAPADAKDPK